MKKIKRKSVWNTYMVILSMIGFMIFFYDAIAGFILFALPFINFIIYNFESKEWFYIIMD